MATLANPFTTKTLAVATAPPTDRLQYWTPTAQCVLLLRYVMSLSLLHGNCAKSAVVLFNETDVYNNNVFFF